MKMKWTIVVGIVVVAVLVLMPILTQVGGDVSEPLRYGDGWADGKKSLGGSGEMIRFTLPARRAKVAAIRIHGGRYGSATPPAEDFIVSFLGEDMSRVVQQEYAPYSLFDRGENRWVEVRFKEPVNVPETFWLVLDFKAAQTKGVYVSYDTSTGGQHSRQGLPGQQGKPVSFGGDWMIEAILTK